MEPRTTRPLEPAEVPAILGPIPGAYRPPEGVMTRRELAYRAVIEALAQLGEARRCLASDESVRMLRPAGTDWMTGAEIEEMQAAQLEVRRLESQDPDRSQDMVSARARVLVRRAQRLASHPNTARCQSPGAGHPGDWNAATPEAGDG